MPKIRRKKLLDSRKYFQKIIEQKIRAEEKIQRKKILEPEEEKIQKPKIRQRKSFTARNLQGKTLRMTKISPEKFQTAEFGRKKILDPEIRRKRNSRAKNEQKKFL